MKEKPFGPWPSLPVPYRDADDLVGPSLLHIRRAGPKAKDAVADTRTDSGVDSGISARQNPGRPAPGAEGGRQRGEGGLTR